MDLEKSEPGVVVTAPAAVVPLDERLYDMLAANHVFKHPFPLKIKARFLSRVKNELKDGNYAVGYDDVERAWMLPLKVETETVPTLAALNDEDWSADRQTVRITRARYEGFRFDDGCCSCLGLTLAFIAICFALFADTHWKYEEQLQLTIASCVVNTTILRAKVEMLTGIVENVHT